MDRLALGCFTIQQAKRWRMGLLLALASLHSALASAQGAYANAMSRAKYTVYTADINGDGDIDFLLKAAPRIVLIGIDEPVTIPLRPTSPTFVALSTSSGSYTIDAAPSPSLVSNAAWQTGTHQLTFGDFSGSGTDGVVIQAKQASAASLSIATNPVDGQPVLTQVLTEQTIGVDLGAGGITTELRDENGDGRADLYVRSGGLIQNVLLANANGLFQNDRSAAIRAVWSAFKEFLSSSNAQGALGYVSDEAYSVYQVAFADLAGELSQMPGTWTDFRALGFDPPYASYAVTQTFEGRATLHRITFVLENGRWKLLDF